MTIIFFTLLDNYREKNKPYSVRLIDIIDKDEEAKLSRKNLNFFEKEINKEIEKYLNSKDNSFKLKQCYYALGAIKFLENENSQSIDYMKKALEYGTFDKTNMKTLELDIRIYSALSSNCISQKKLEESELFFTQAKSLALKNNQKHLLCELYYGKAKSIVSSGYNINEAIDLLRKSLEYTDLESHQVRNYLYLSTLYKLIEDFDLALEYIINALEISMNLNDTVLINKCIINLGENYYVQKNYSKTIYIYESYFTENKLQDVQNKLTVYGYLAECYSKEGDYSNYKKYKDNYLELAKEINDIRSMVWIYAVCAEAEMEFLNLDTAKEYLNKAQLLHSENIDTMYPNIDIMLDFVKNKINYFETKDYNTTLNNYGILLKKLNLRGIKSDINSVIIDEVLNISLQNDDFKTFKQCIQVSNPFNKKHSSQTYTDSIYSGLNNIIKERELIKSKMRTTILFILTLLSIGAVINSNIKNKKIKKLNTQIKELSILDPLTRLYNRGYLNEKFIDIQKNKEHISFMMIDIDFFKLYNDNYGHIKGDQVLIEVARIISYVFKDDLVFRYGGEEFSVISNKTQEEVIKHLEELNLKLYSENIIHEYSKVSDRITLSIGLASKQIQTEDDLLELTNLADENLYKSKKAGRNRYTY